MAKRFRLAVIIFVAAIGCCATWAILYPTEHHYSEPSYEGRALSVWLNDYWIISHGLFEEQMNIEHTNARVDKAVRKIGANAIPTLFRMLNATDPPLRKLSYLARDRGFYRFADCFKFNSAPALAQNIQAAKAFRALGPQASNAVPVLVKMFDEWRYDQRRELVAGALGGIGPPAGPAVPSLLRAVTDPDSAWVPRKSLRALGEIHADPERVVPVLVGLLQNRDADVRMLAIIDLQDFGTNARPAIPALIELLVDPVEYIRRDATNAIKAIDTAAATQAGAQ